MFKSIFRTALTDVHAFPGKEELGVLRVEVDGKYGERWFRYLQNATGSPIAADSFTMYDGNFVSPLTIANSTTTKVIRASGSFVADGYKVDDILIVIDDAGAAGAAPEGESSFITGVRALELDISPALSAAPAVNDTVSVIKRASIIASAAGAGKRSAGIPMAAIAAGSCGWVQTRGIYPSADVLAAGTAVAEGDRLAAGTAILTVMATVAANANSGVDVNEVAVATALQSLASDTVRRKCVVMLEVQ
jgi:hypothetical protein